MNFSVSLRKISFWDKRYVKGKLLFAFNLHKMFKNNDNIAKVIKFNIPKEIFKNFINLDPPEEHSVSLNRKFMQKKFLECLFIIMCPIN